MNEALKDRLPVTVVATECDAIADGSLCLNDRLVSDACAEILYCVTVGEGEKRKEKETRNKKQADR